MKKVLILCTGNSCRSQMAEGYFRFFSGSNAKIYSAGIEAHGLNPMAVRVMKEDSIDISDHRSKVMDEFQDMNFDFVITVCDNAQESCPTFPAKTETFHKNFEDPAKALGTDEDKLNKFREVRAKIKSFTREFVNQYLQD